MTQNRYKATVDGQDYTIIGQESKQHMDMVTALVNEQLNEIKQLSPGITTEKAAILLAINAMSDQLLKQEENLKLQKKLTAKEQEAAHSIERIKKIEAVEAEAKEILRQQGKDETSIRNHVDAQDIVNKNRQREIQKRAADK